MIVVDTSVWIAAKRQPTVARVLQQLMDEDMVALALPVRLELWTGVPRHHRQEHAAAFGAFPQLVPTEETWAPLTEWIARARDAGESFTITHLLIAALASEIGGLVWSLDKDFERMERLEFVQLYQLQH